MKSYPALHYMMMIVGTWHHQQTITPLLHTSVGFKMCVGLSMHVFSSNLLRNPPGGAPHSPRGPCIFHRLWMGTLCLVTSRDRQLFHPKPFIFTEIMSPTGINRAAGLNSALPPCRQACRVSADRPVTATKVLILSKMPR